MSNCGPNDNYEIIIDQYVQELSKSKEHYERGKSFTLNLDSIAKLTGFDLKKYKPREAIESPSIDIVINAFYKKRNF